MDTKVKRVRDIKVDVPEGVSGDWAVKKFTVSDADASFHNLRASFHSGRVIDVGEYIKLTRNGKNHKTCKYRINDIN